MSHPWRGSPGGNIRLGPSAASGHTCTMLPPRWRLRWKHERGIYQQKKMRLRTDRRCHFRRYQMKGRLLFDRCIPCPSSHPCWVSLVLGMVRRVRTSGRISLLESFSPAFCEDRACGDISPMGTFFFLSLDKNWRRIKNFSSVLSRTINLHV